mgnify:FL=1
MVMTHVLFESGRMVLLDLSMVRFCILLETSDECGGVFLKQVKRQFEQIVIFKIATKALFLMLRIDIAQRLVAK